MSSHIKTLIIIIAIAAFVFHFARKSFDSELKPNEFERWRNSWLALTVVAFLAGNFWLFILVSAGLVLYAAKSSDNKPALFVALMLVVPAITEEIPAVLDVTYLRLLSMLILLPILLSSKNRKGTPAFGKLFSDKLLIAFIFLQTVLLLRDLSFTEMLRQGFYLLLEWFLPYFVASRILNFKQLKIVLIAFVLACLIAGSLGTFELTTSWLLYNTLANSLQVDWHYGSYLGRGEDLRALSSLGHPLMLGFVMMVAMGIFLFLKSLIKSKKMRLGVFLMLAAGLIAPISRGPWVGVATLGLVFIVTGPKAIQRLSMLLIALVIAIPILPSVPGGKKIIDLIPFVGTVDKFNVDYREVLIDRSLLIVKRAPLFGVFDPKEEPEMADMVQGEGIVDIVNVYLVYVLESGITGLMLFISFFALILLQLRKTIKRVKNKKSEEYLCGRSLFATIIGILITISTVSPIGVIPTVYYIIAGLSVSYIRIVRDLRKNEQLLSQSSSPSLPNADKLT